MHQADAATGANLFAGTSGWAYSTWKPGFYPPKLSARKFLEHYSSRLNSVEVNYTFRKLPEKAQLQGWIDATPPDFRFTFKVPQSITHLRRLRECDEPLTAFLAALKPVAKAGKQGAILFQFPPNFRADALGKDKQANREALAAFLKTSRRALRRTQWPAAIEFRDAGWFCQQTYDLLRRYNVALCAAESVDLATPDVDTADFHYSRMRAPHYTESRLRNDAKLFCERAAHKPVYVYYKHEDAPDGPLRAEKLLQLSRKRFLGGKRD